MTNSKIIIGVMLLLGASHSGCTKFLDQKPSAAMAVPRNLNDLQALADNTVTMNYFVTHLGEASADNYFLDDNTLNSRPEFQRNLYLWDEDINAGISIITQYPWNAIYNAVFLSNTILQQLNEENRVGKETQWNHIKGAALFFRARSFLTAIINWAPPYDATQPQQNGIVLRLSPNFTDASSRSDLQTSYNQVIADLEMAIQLLPVTPQHVLRPSKPAAYALLSRAYLSMREYGKAGIYADSALQMKNDLLKFSEIQDAVSSPFREFNAEVIFQAGGSPSSLSSNIAHVDSTLYSMYVENDRRRILYFRPGVNGQFRFKGTYSSGTSMFSGIATDEVYMTRAECLVREGKVHEGLDVLNTLMVTRWEAGTFVPFTAVGQAEALEIVLTERRKELLMRDLRWMDLKRLNWEPEHAVTIKRVAGGQLYELPPNDLRYAIQLPFDMLAITGIEANPR